MLAPHEQTDAELLWEFHNLAEEPRHSGVAVLMDDSEQLGQLAAGLYEKRLFTMLVAAEPIAGIPAAVQIRATPPGDLDAAQDALRLDGRSAASVLLICPPHLRRLAQAIGRRVWPDADVSSAALPATFDEALADDGTELVNELAGATQRLLVFPSMRRAVAQEVPNAVLGAYERLVAAGHTGALLDLGLRFDA